MEEEKWFRVSLYLKYKLTPVLISMTKKELDELKSIKMQGQKYYFETKHESSDRLLVDVTQIQAIMEIPDLGDD